MTGFSIAKAVYDIFYNGTVGQMRSLIERARITGELEEVHDSFDRYVEKELDNAVARQVYLYNDGWDQSKEYVETVKSDRMNSEIIVKDVGKSAIEYKGTVDYMVVKGYTLEYEICVKWKVVPFCDKGLFKNNTERYKRSISNPLLEYIEKGKDGQSIYEHFKKLMSNVIANNYNRLYAEINLMQKSVTKRIISVNSIMGYQQLKNIEAQIKFFELAMDKSIGAISEENSSSQTTNYFEDLYAMVSINQRSDLSGHTVMYKGEAEVFEDMLEVVKRDILYTRRELYDDRRNRDTRGCAE